jgi:hypothetical protein
MARRFPFVVAVLVLVVGWAWVSVGAIPFEPDIDDVCRGPGAPSERASQHTHTALWPPGATECRWTGPAGSGSSVYVPWTEWLVVALCAAGAFLVASALSRDTRRPLWRLAGGLLLPLIGLAAWFGGFS